MLNINDIKKTWEEENNNPLGNFSLNESLKTLIKELIGIEKEFQKINSNYNIVFSPSQVISKEKNIEMKLLLNNDEIAYKSTAINFMKYHGEERYFEGENIKLRLSSNPEKEISFYKKPKLYTEITCDFFIQEFLNNEKKIARQLAIEELNKTVRLEEPKSTLRNHL